MRTAVTLFAVLLMAVSCSHKDANSDGKPVVALSYESQKYIADRISGGTVETVVLLPQGTDPETFDPDMKVMRGLSQADLLLTFNSLGFESKLCGNVQSNFPNVKIIDISKGITLIGNTHALACAGHSHGGESGHDDSGFAADPHLLSSVKNAKIVALNIFDALKTVNPADSVLYRTNLEKLNGEFDRADGQIDSLLSGGGSFLVTHPSLSYFARDYGLTQIPLEQDGKEASPSQIKQRLQNAANSGATVLFYERGHGESAADTYSNSLGIKAVPLVLNAYGFKDELIKAAREIHSSKAPEAPHE